MHTESDDPEYSQTRIRYFIYNRKKGDEVETQSLFPLAAKPNSRA
jgi:hypothetical protein